MDESVVVSNLPGGISLGLDDRHVYWTDHQRYWPETHIDFWYQGVSRCPLTGCAPYAPTSVTGGDVSPWGVVVIGDYFHWTDMNKGRVTRVVKPR